MNRMNKILKTKVQLQDVMRRYNWVSCYSADLEIMGENVCFSCKNIQRHYQIHVLVMVF